MVKRYTPVASCVLVGLWVGACAEPLDVVEDEGDIFVEEILDRMPNNVPIPNADGFAAVFAGSGYVDLESNFFTAWGTNGRHCGTCHAPEDGFGLNGSTVTMLFQLTGGTHPLFANNLDSDRPNAEARDIPGSIFKTPRALMRPLRLKVQSMGHS